MSVLLSIDGVPVATAASSSVAMMPTTIRVSVAAPDPALHVESTAPGSPASYAREATVIGTVDSSGLPVLETFFILAASALAIVDWHLQNQRAEGGREKAAAKLVEAGFGR